MLWLIRHDMRLRQFTSSALWIPVIHLAIVGSRPVGQWFGGGSSPGGSSQDGNTLNLVIFGILNIASLIVLAQRRLNWGLLLKDNKALFLIFFYLALTSLWSPDTFVTLKRITRDFGNVLIALVFLTETDPVKAVRIVFVRLSYILFPLSVLFIRFFPSLGRNFSKGGELMFTGVTSQKNSLGEIVIVFGLILLLDLLEIRKEGSPKAMKIHRIIRYGMMAMALWLLFTCQSQTSLVCVILGVVIFMAAARIVRMRRPRIFLLNSFLILVFLATLDKTFSISSTVVEALGRDMTFTGRTEIWAAVMEQAKNIDPILGFGYCSFWESRLGATVVEDITSMITAHNGYLEIYLDGGAVGIVCLLIFLISSVYKTMNDMLGNTYFGRLQFIYCVIAIVYNYTESNFFRFGPLWFTFLLMLISCPPPGRNSQNA